MNGRLRHPWLSQRCGGVGSLRLRGGWEGWIAGDGQCVKTTKKAHTPTASAVNEVLSPCSAAETHVRLGACVAGGSLPGYEDFGPHAANLLRASRDSVLNQVVLFGALGATHLGAGAPGG
jgi:hypothetical protein